MQKLRAKGVRYWATALVILVLAFTASPYVYDYLNLKQRRADVFQYLLEKGPKPTEPKFVRLVLIGDDEYWLGDPAGRRPIKRDYLARLVDALVQANVRVIALDFDVRLPNPQSMAIPEEYQKETKTLIRAIVNAAARGKKVVLATPISYDRQGQYQRDPDIYQASGLCLGGSAAADATIDQSALRNISCGYIALPYEPVVIPGQLPMANGSLLDSFALAVARAERPVLIQQLLARTGTSVRYGNFISEQKFADYHASFSARDVLQGTVEKDKLEGGAVIIGAQWSTFAADRGSRVDQHWTPIGPMVGAVLHANFTEALLDARTFSATPQWVLQGTEIIFSLIAAVTLALISGLVGKIVAFVSLILWLFLIQITALYGFGVFFDAFVPLLGLALHSIYERLAFPYHA